MPLFQTRVSRTTVALLLLFWLAALGFCLGVHGALKIFGPGPLHQSKEIMIERGSSIEDISHLLQEQGIIRRWWSWAIMARLGVNPNHIKAGEYLIPPGVSAWGALDIIRRGDVIIRKLTVPEGLTSYEITQLVLAHPLLRGAIERVPEEGTLLPETYYFQRGDERSILITRMQNEMKKTLDELWPQRDPAIPLKDVKQVITLASIVEKETGHPEERPRVAGVFYNRLKKNMALQSDPTTIYALTGGKGSIQTVLGRQLRRSDWQLQSPYNTYAVRGLPPGPIANPGRASLEAVLKPETNNYIFFVADGSGGHTFAEDYSAHKDNIAARQREVKKAQAEAEKAKRDAEKAALAEKKKAEAEAKKAEAEAKKAAAKKEPAKKP